MKKLSLEEMSKIEGGRWYWYLIDAYRQVYAYADSLMDEIANSIRLNQGVDTLPPSNNNNT